MSDTPHTTKKGDEPTVITLVLPTDTTKPATVTVRNGDLGHMNTFHYDGFADIATALNAGMKSFVGVQASPPTDIQSAKKKPKQKRKKKAPGKPPYKLQDSSGDPRTLDVMFDPFELQEKYHKTNPKFEFDDLEEAEAVAATLINAGMEKAITITYSNGKPVKTLPEDPEDDDNQPSDDDASPDDDSDNDDESPMQSDDASPDDDSDNNDESSVQSDDASPDDDSDNDGESSVQSDDPHYQVDQIVYAAQTINRENHDFTTVPKATSGTVIRVCTDDALIQRIKMISHGWHNGVSYLVAWDIDGQEKTVWVLEDDVATQRNTSPIEPGQRAIIGGGTSGNLLDEVPSSDRIRARIIRDHSDLVRDVATEQNDSDHEYPASLDTSAKQAIFDVVKDEDLARVIYDDIQKKKKHGWKKNLVKQREVKGIIAVHVDGKAAVVEALYQLALDSFEFDDRDASAKPQKKSSKKSDGAVIQVLTSPDKAKRDGVDTYAEFSLATDDEGDDITDDISGISGDLSDIVPTDDKQTQLL